MSPTFRENTNKTEKAIELLKKYLGAFRLFSISAHAFLWDRGKTVKMSPTSEKS